MKIRPLSIDGALLLEPENAADRRGFFTRGWCRRLLEARGLDPALARTEVAVHRAAGEIRAPRCLAAPWQEAMLVRCTRGAVRLALVDVRGGTDSDAPLMRVIDAKRRHAVYLPPGVALGYQTLDSDAEVFLQHAEVPPVDATEQRLETRAIDWPLPVASAAL